MCGDYDNDGKPDVVVSHLNEPVVVLQNIAPADGRHWVGRRLYGEKGAGVTGSRVVPESAGGKRTRFVKAARATSARTTRASTSASLAPPASTG